MHKRLNSKRKKPVTLTSHIPNFSQSPDIRQNSGGSICNFCVSGQPLNKENYHNSRTSDDIDMKLGPVTKTDNRKKAKSKSLTMTSCQLIVMALSLLQLMVNLEPSGNWIPDA